MFHECDPECSEYKDKDHPIPNRWVIDEWEFSRCPLTDIDKNIFQALHLYSFMKKGITPNGQGCLQESSKYIEMMTYIDGKIAEHKSKDNHNGR